VKTGIGFIPVSKGGDRKIDPKLKKNFKNITLDFLKKEA